MRKSGLLWAASLAAATLFAAPSPATADAATPPTLTVGVLGGAPVNPGDLISASLTPGSSLTFTTAPSSGPGLICPQSAWQIIAGPNPPVPGPATLTLRQWTISECTDTIPGVISVVGVFPLNVADIQVLGNGAFPVVIGPVSAPLQIIAKVISTAGNETCTYEEADFIRGLAGLGTIPWTFAAQPFALVSGPPQFCGAPTEYLNTSFSRFIDTTQGNQAVLVN